MSGFWLGFVFGAAVVMAVLSAAYEVERRRRRDLWWDGFRAAQRADRASIDIALSRGLSLDEAEARLLGEGTR